MPSFNSSKKEFDEYIIHLKTNSVEYLIDHFNESQLIIDGDGGGSLWKFMWFTFTDKEKKDNLDRDIDKYFGRETPIDVNVIVEPMRPGWEKRIFEQSKWFSQMPQDDY